MTGGPAFPSDGFFDREAFDALTEAGADAPWSHDSIRSLVSTSTGMTLRDWFAGQFVAGDNGSRLFSAELVAKEAYALADAMLRARNGGGK